MNVSSVGGAASAQALAGAYASRAQAGSVMQQAQVSVLKKAIDTEAEITLRLVNSAVGGNLDVKG